MAATIATTTGRTGRFDDWVGVGSSVPSVSTIKSPRTADFEADSKRAVSVGIFAGIVLVFRSPVTLAVSQVDFSLPSLHPKIPFPAAGFRRPKPSAVGNIGSPGMPKAPFSTRLSIRLMPLTGHPRQKRRWRNEFCGPHQMESLTQ